MKNSSEIKFYSSAEPNLNRLATLLNADSAHPHIHRIDMPFRLSSTWQDEGCEVGMWERGGELLAWAVFMPPWWNLDYAIHPSMRGTALEAEVFRWGRDQIVAYSARSGQSFWGSIEMFEDTPHVTQSIAHLDALGFRPFEWSTRRFEIELQPALPEAQLPEGFALRPLHGASEIDVYIGMHRAAFGSSKMTSAWRGRTLAHPDYRPELDLVVVDAEDVAVGFCVCWLSAENIGQIEPLGILPAYQGLGLGRALELSALHLFREHGATHVQVDHTSFNEAAIALSLQTGFKQINNALRYFVSVDPVNGLESATSRQA